MVLYVKYTVVHTVVFFSNTSGVRKRDRAFFCPRVVAFPGQQNLRTSGCINTPQALASSIRSGALYISLPPPIEASAFTLFLLPFTFNLNDTLFVG